MTLSPTHGQSARTPDRARRLVLDLMRFRRVLSLRELTQVIAHAGLTREDLVSFVKTREAGYARREVFRNPYFEVGCIGWRRGQQTPIHDHGDSDCCVLVLAGILTNISYRPVGTVRAARVATSWLRAGEVLALNGPAIHRMANEHDTDLLTLHVYLPPLISMHERIRLEMASESYRSPGEST